MEIVIRNRKELPSAAGRLLHFAGDEKIFAFYGTLGAGKTTIIKSLCRILGAAETTSSPTFTLVNEYLTSKGESIYHIDFYRIKKQDEVFDFGIEEYLTGESYCFMEWPELIEELLPPGTVRVRITVGEGEKRILSLSLS